MSIPFNARRSRSAGYTMVEMLMAIGMVVALGKMASLEMRRALLSAKIKSAIADIQSMQKLVAQYRADTGEYPPSCTADCTEITDPFWNPLGKKGWAGPYFQLYKKVHPWGGHLSIWWADMDGDGKEDCMISLDDSRPLMTETDCLGGVPDEGLLSIDARLDDSNLGTGYVRGGGLGFNSQPGELMVRCAQ